MRIVGMMPVRNEAWVLGFSARAALRWCDSLVVLNHASTDNTFEVLRDLKMTYHERLQVIEIMDGRWDEMFHRQMLLTRARQDRATHLAIIDADEILSGSIDPDSIRNWVCELGDRTLQLPLFNVRGELHRYHLSGIWGNRIVSVAFKDVPQAGWRGDQFHHREPFGITIFPSQPLNHSIGGVIHLWGITERRLVAKHALYKMNERIYWPSKPVDDINHQYNLAIYETSSSVRYGSWTFGTLPQHWWDPYLCWREYLDLEAIPWQEAECRRLLDLHGSEAFTGLDLFGVV